MKRFLCSLFVLAALSSCNDPQPTATHGFVGERSKNTEYRLAANPDNPYDSIGIWHNIILDSLRRYELSSGDTTRSGHNLYLVRFAKKYRRTSLSLSHLPEQESAIRKDFKGVLYAQKLSGNAKLLLRELITVLESIQSTEHFADYKKDIQHLEDQILHSGLGEKEMGFLLIIASMLRHSGYYWMNVFSQLPEDNARKSGFLRKLLGAISSIGADVTSAAYHYAKNTRPDGIILEASRMSYICGYYTGWYQNEY